MKRIRTIAVTTLLVMFGGASAVYAAASVLTPGDIAAGLTGKSQAELYEERSAGKTYGAIASEAGKLEEFKSQMLEQKKALLNQKVLEGKITQDQAEQVLEAIENNQAACDGNGFKGAEIGKSNGLCFGQGRGKSSPMGRGRGLGYGLGRGQGL